MHLLDGWEKQQEKIKTYECPYCHRKLATEREAQLHWAKNHKRHGHVKPIYKKVSDPVAKEAKRKEQLTKAQQKGRESRRKHRTARECKETIEHYEENLKQTTAREYFLEFRISKQKIHQIRARLKNCSPNLPE